MLQLTTTAWSRELPPDPFDTTEATRWTTVVPLPAQREPKAGVWKLDRTVLVDWGPVVGPERDDLGERLDTMLSAVGRRWRPARATETASLWFRGEGGVGEGYTLGVSPWAPWSGRVRRPAATTGW